MTNQASRKQGENPDVETLKNDPLFHQILELDFNDMIPFVLKYIRKPGWVPRIFMILHAAFLAFIIGFMIWGVSAEWLKWAPILRQSLLGIFAGSILVIPPHELLHGMVYWILGARKISFGADLQQFIFYVTADRFPISGNQLYFLAMTPFVVINVMVIVITALWMPQITLFSAFLLLSHNVMCIGDFAMVNYVRQTPGELYTFDEIDQMKSFFFKKADEPLLQ